MARTIEAMRSEGISYRGILYGGLMIGDSTPYTLEFNARFGDPETQPLLFHMETDLLPILAACVEGRLTQVPQIQWKKGVSICVVLASKGYPDSPEKGKVVEGLEGLKSDARVMVFHAGTRKEGNRIYTAGGRVLGVTATGDTYEEAIRIVYEAVSCIQFEGMQYRADIGKKALNR
jgi:phosphoribosylamine--glycine ligase